MTEPYSVAGEHAETDARRLAAVRQGLLQAIHNLTLDPDVVASMRLLTGALAERWKTFRTPETDRAAEALADALDGKVLPSDGQRRAVDLLQRLRAFHAAERAALRGRRPHTCALLGRWIEHLEAAGRWIAEGRPLPATPVNTAALARCVVELGHWIFPLEEAVDQGRGGGSRDDLSDILAVLDFTEHVISGSTWNNHMLPSVAFDAVIEPLHARREPWIQKGVLHLRQAWDERFARCPWAGDIRLLDVQKGLLVALWELEWEATLAKIVSTGATSDFEAERWVQRAMEGGQKNPYRVSPRAAAAALRKVLSGETLSDEERRRAVKGLRRFRWFEQGDARSCRKQHAIHSAEQSELLKRLLGAAVEWLRAGRPVLPLSDDLVALWRCYWELVGALTAWETEAIERQRAAVDVPEAVAVIESILGRLAGFEPKEPAIPPVAWTHALDYLRAQAEQPWNDSARRLIGRGIDLLQRNKDGARIAPSQDTTINSPGNATVPVVSRSVDCED